MTETNEIGRELKADELREGTVVISRGDHRPEYAITVWVSTVGAGFVELYAGAATPPIRLFLNRQPDGTLEDGLGRRIRVYEYLGEI